MKDHTFVWYLILGIIVVVSAVGTLAFLYYTTNQSTIANQITTARATPTTTVNRSSVPSASPAPTIDPQTTALKVMSNEDTLESIEKDINDTNLENLQPEVAQIEELLQ